MHRTQRRAVPESSQVVHAIAMGRDVVSARRARVLPDEGRGSEAQVRLWEVLLSKRAAGETEAHLLSRKVRSVATARSDDTAAVGVVRSLVDCRCNLREEWVMPLGCRLQASFSGYACPSHSTSSVEECSDSIEGRICDPRRGDQPSQEVLGVCSASLTLPSRTIGRHAKCLGKGSSAAASHGSKRERSIFSAVIVWLEHTAPSIRSILRQLTYHTLQGPPAAPSTKLCRGA